MHSGYLWNLSITLNLILSGLDPAGPLFETYSREASEKLDYSDAIFVDVIHTCGGVLGFASAIGTVDFFPNGGGPPQPGCGNIQRIFGNIKTWFIQKNMF